MLILLMSHKYANLIKCFVFLIRMPFTKLKKIEKFREEINGGMKVFLKTFRKKLSENLFNEIKSNVKFKSDQN